VPLQDLNKDSDIIIPWSTKDEDSIRMGTVLPLVKVNPRTGIILSFSIGFNVACHDPSVKTNYGWGYSHKVGSREPRILGDARTALPTECGWSNGVRILLSLFS
jgi:hypothetical protein